MKDLGDGFGKPVIVPKKIPAASRTHDHKRDGTTALFAAMNTLEAPSGSFLVGMTELTIVVPRSRFGISLKKVWRPGPDAVATRLTEQG